MFTRYQLAIILLCLTGNLFAQSKQIVIETSHSALVLNVGGNQRVTQSYLGKN
ncbi:hypothetical protein [Paraflavitalea speifideaquila]|uniref:hypothetical protein n=1 Tax=Paraflavitalea speifideaquila TaxID=3076558 RepID=UPI0028F10502|nr:hypothetical protein [Paraflavitalea speifideiaquila]